MTSSALLGGDPVSCSRLGGTMRRRAGRLADRAREVTALLDEADGRELALVESAADALDRAGRLLQAYATELAEVHEQARRLDEGVSAAGLELQDARVVEPWGPAPSEDAESRRQRLPELQLKTERVTAAAGRSRSLLRRGAAELVAELAGLAGELRGIPGARQPGAEAGADVSGRDGRDG